MIGNALTFKDTMTLHPRVLLGSSSTHQLEMGVYSLTRGCRAPIESSHWEGSSWPDWVLEGKPESCPPFKGFFLASTNPDAISTSP